MLKKIAISILVVLVLIIGTLVAVPMFYSIDNLRPQIQAAVEKSIRGKVELGKLSMGLFPSISIKIDGVKVKAPAPFDKEDLAVIKAIEIKMPLSSFLMAPTGTFVIGPTDVKLISRGLKSNLSETLPPPLTTEELKSAQVEAKKASPLSDTLKGLPSFIGSRVAAARFDFVLENLNADIIAEGAPKGDFTKLKSFSAKLSGIGIESDMKLSAKGELDVSASGANVKGPIESQGTLRYKPVSRDHQITLNMKNDLKALDIAFKPLFHKAANVPFGAGLEGVISAGIERTDIQLKKLSFQFANVELEGSLKASTDAIDPTKGEFAANFVVDNFDLAAWGTLVPMVRDFKLGGKVGMTIKSSGPILDPSIDLSVKMKDVTGATPTLQKPISNLNGEIRVSGTAKNPTVEINPFGMKLGSGDLNLRLKTQGVENISLDMFVGSSNLDADELLGITPETMAKAAAEAKKAEAEAAKVAKAEKAAGKAAPVAPGLPLDETLALMAPDLEKQLENPMLDKIKATIKTDFKKIKITGANLTDATFNMTYEKRRLNIAKTGLGAFGGKVLFDMGLDLRNPKAMGYTMNAGLTAVDVGQMTTLYAPQFKNDISGRITGNFNIAGSGLRKEQLAKNLDGGLKGAFDDGRFSLPFMNLALDTIEEVLAEYAKKGGLLGKAANLAGASASKEADKDKPRFNGEFKTAKIDSAIKGREIKLTSLDIEFKEQNNKPASFKGKGLITFDRAVDFEGVATVSSNNPKFECLQVSPGTISVPMRVTGTMDVPKNDYAYSAKVLIGTCAKKAGAQQTQKVAEKAIDEAAKKLGVKDEKKVEEAKKAVGGALKKLFGK